MYIIAYQLNMPFKHYILLVCATIVLYTCKHFKPKPVSGDITKTTVPLNGRKDSVIINDEKNYGNATASSICVKCLLSVIQGTDSYKQFTFKEPQKNIVYEVNWITSKQPFEIGRFGKVISGMQVTVNEKKGTTKKFVTTYVYTNENALLYFKNDSNGYDKVLNADSAALQKVRRSCFWGVSSSR